MLSKSELDDLKQSMEVNEPYYTSVEAEEEREAYVSDLTKTVDVVCPVVASGWRQSDLDTLAHTTDPRLFNQIAATLVENHVRTGVDTSKMSDEEVAELAIPRDADMQYAERLAADALAAPAPAEVPVQSTD